MGDLYFLNYSDDRFNRHGGNYRKNQQALNDSAVRHGINKIVAWTWEDLVLTEIYQKNKSYFEKDSLDNGHAFKPLIIFELFKKISDGDIVFYCDCGPYIIRRSIDPLIRLCIQNGGTLFHQTRQKNKAWTKRDAFVLMNCDQPRYHNGTHLQSGWLLIQKTERNMEFVKEWLHYNLDERISSRRKSNVCGFPNFKGFVEHREDQSIFTNLAIKYRIKTFYGAGGGLNRDVNYFIESLTFSGNIIMTLLRIFNRGYQCFQVLLKAKR